MHIAEGMLPLWLVAATSAAAAPLILLGARHVRALWLDPAPGPRALVSLGAALTFALTAFPLPLPWLGISSHLCAIPMLGVLLGLKPAIFIAALVLALEAALLGHGGLTTLGANTLTLGLCGAGVARLVWALASRVSPPLVAAALSCGLGHAATYAAAALLVGVAISPAAPLAGGLKILALLAPMQLPLAVLEGLVGAMILRAVARRRPEAVPGWRRAAPALLVAALCMLSPAMAAAEEDGVFEAAIAQARGATPEAPAPDDGLLAQLALVGGMFAAGVATGRAWTRLEGG